MLDEFLEFWVGTSNFQGLSWQHTVQDDDWNGGVAVSHLTQSGHITGRKGQVFQVVAVTSSNV
jgi:hypothetical protein